MHAQFFNNYLVATMEWSAAVVLLYTIVALLSATRGAVHTLADGGGSPAQPIGVNVSSERMETVKPVVTYRSENTVNNNRNVKNNYCYYSKQ